MNVEVFESEDKLRDAIRQTVRDQIQFSADVTVNEALDFNTIHAYSMKYAKFIGIGGALLGAIVTMATAGAFPMALIVGAGAGVVSAISGYFVGRRVALTNKKVADKLMNKQISNKFDVLVDVVEKRDAMLKEFARYKTVSERNKYSKRVGGELKRLGEQMQKISQELRADILELGNDNLDINEYDYENLMSFLKKGEKAAVSDVLSDRNSVAKLEEVEGSEEDMAA